MLLSSNQQNTVTIVTKIDNIHSKNFQWVSNIILKADDKFEFGKGLNGCSSFQPGKIFSIIPIQLLKMLDNSSGRILNGLKWKHHDAKSSKKGNIFRTQRLTVQYRNSDG